MSFRSKFEASKAFSAEATFFALERFTWAPQYGQILVFCSFVVNIKPWHWVHLTIWVGFINLASESLFPTRVDKGMQGKGCESMSEDKVTVKPRAHLIGLAVKYFKKEGYKVNREEATLEGYSGETRHFDLIVQKGRQEQGVWVRDWNRTSRRQLNHRIGYRFRRRRLRQPNHDSGQIQRPRQKLQQPPKNHAAHKAENGQLHVTLIAYGLCLSFFWLFK